MSNDSNNCYYTDFQFSRRTYMCNVARHVLVVYPANKDRMAEVRFNVKLELKFDHGPVTRPVGDYNCPSSQPAIADYFKTHSKLEIAKVMGWDSNKMPLLMSCQNESCSDTRNGYNWGKPWKELKSCDQLGG